MLHWLVKDTMISVWLQCHDVLAGERHHDFSFTAVSYCVGWWKTPWFQFDCHVMLHWLAKDTMISVWQQCHIMLAGERHHNFSLTAVSYCVCWWKTPWFEFDCNVMLAGERHYDLGLIPIPHANGHFCLKYHCQNSDIVIEHHWLFQVFCSDLELASVCSVAAKFYALAFGLDMAITLLQTVLRYFH